MSDSQHIINFLNKEFNIDLNKHLTPPERATAWAIQKWLEEFTYWLNIYTRWCIRVDDMLGVYTPNSPFYDKEKIKTRVSNNAHAQGVGRHTDEEVGEMIRHDLTMLSEILGCSALSNEKNGLYTNAIAISTNNNSSPTLITRRGKVSLGCLGHTGEKTFFMGDKPTELDCAAFGQLAQIRWATPDSCPGKSLMKEKLKNLMAFTDRIKELYWPDWNERILGDRG